MKSILQVFYSVFSGILLSLAIPNEIYLLGCPIFAFIALIPFYLSLKNTKNYKQAFLLGFINGLTTHLCSSFWLAFFKDMAIFTLGASAIATAILEGIFTLFLCAPFIHHTKKTLIFYKTQKQFYQKESFRIFYFSAIYTLYEFIKSNGFIGYPWGTVSSAMYKFPILTQLASITGTYGITFLVVCFNALISEIFDNSKYFVQKITKKEIIKKVKDVQYAAIVFLSLFILTMIYGLYEYYKTRIPTKQIKTIFVQQNIDSWELINEEKNILTAENLTKEKINELNKINQKPELIVWSEGSLNYTLPQSKGYYECNPYEEPLINFIKENQTPLITGAPYQLLFFKVNEYEPYDKRLYNASVLFDKDGILRGYYAKQHLVPFAEYIPFIRNPIVKKICKTIAQISSGWDPGEQFTCFEIPCTKLLENCENKKNVIDITNDYQSNSLNNTQTSVRIGTPVCFDDAFSNVMTSLYQNGAELFVNISDDSWSLTKSSEYQHFVIASYRAIEFRTSFLRSTNAGYSVAMDPTGKILIDLPLFIEKAEVYDIPIYKRETTIYSIYGDWLPQICYIFLLCCIYFMCTKQKQYEF